MRARARDPARADHLHAWTAETDHVVDGIASLNVAALRIDNDADVAAAFGGVGEQLPGDTLCDLHVDFAENEHHAGLEQCHLHRRHRLIGLYALALVLFGV